MARYILRRLLGAVLLLVITSMVTFAIFFVVPRLAGQTVDQLAAQYVGKDPSQAVASPESLLRIVRQPASTSGISRVQPRTDTREVLE